MKYITKLLAYGWGISFLGALPLGVINITVFEISASTGLASALWFSFGVILVEVFIVWLTLKYDHLLDFKGKFVRIMLPLAILLLFILAIKNFLALNSLKEVVVPKAQLPTWLSSTFLFGILLSTFNPLQFPYWIGCNKVLISKQTLINSSRKRLPYIVGVGLGTLSALLLFIGFGQYIIDNYTHFRYIIKLVLVIIYICFMLYLAYIYLVKYNLKKRS